MRQPRRLMRDLGPAGFFSFQLIVGGNALAALVHPLFIAGLDLRGGQRHPTWRGRQPGRYGSCRALWTTIVAGYLTSVFLGWLGLKRRGLLTAAWVLLLTPVHWLLLSLAAWRALYQLVVSPYVWEKTEHGLAKNSRLASRTTRSLLELERHLRRLKDSGLLPTLSDETRALPVRVAA